MANIIFYRCERCGNMVALLKNGGGTLVCCGQEMKALKANTTDASQEKHVPDIVKEDGKIKVQIGSTLHPSLPEHYIEWIALVSEDKLWVTYLKPGMFFASTFWTKLQNIFGHCCMSKLDKIAMPRLATNIPATSHCRHYLIVKA